MFCEDVSLWTALVGLICTAAGASPGMLTSMLSCLSTRREDHSGHDELLSS